MKGSPGGRTDSQALASLRSPLAGFYSELDPKLGCSGNLDSSFYIIKQKTNC